jgi:carbon-monoxide dehydrogenase medium subunit
MYSFKYLPAQSVKEVVALLSEYGDEAKILGGGQSLVNLLKQNLMFPSYLIDIKGISDLDYIRYNAAEGLRIGALTTHRTLETSAVVKEKYTMLAAMEHNLASVQIRNWGTLGGSLAHADPASDLATTLLALGAKVAVTGPKGERVISLDDFFIDYFETALEADEILTEIHIPNPGQGGGYYYKFARRATDLAIVSVAVHLILDPHKKNLCKDVRIAMGSVGPIPLRSKRGEELLRGQVITETLMDDVGHACAKDARPTTDMNGSEEYKRQILHVLVKRTIGNAVTRA